MLRSIAFFAIGFFIGRSFWDNFIFGVGITVTLIPEGMLPTVTLALAMGSQRMAKRNALIKTLTSVETLGSVSVICTDKTGTLTQNRMDVKEATGLGTMSEYTRKRLFAVALHSNNTKIAGEELKGEPTETALFRSAREVLGQLPGARLREFPFDPDRKRMSTVTGMDGRTFVLTNTRLVLTLREGRKRQMRRALLALDHPVRRLVRVRMGPLRLGDLPSRRARPLTAREERELLRFARASARAGSPAATGGRERTARSRSARPRGGRPRKPRRSG